MIKATAIRAHKFDPHAFEREFVQAGQKIADGMLKDFQKTTKTWEHEVKFETQVSASSNRMNVTVFTQDEIYGYVNDGTKRHRIKPKKKGGVLAFPSTFSPKTKVRVIGSTKGKKGKVDVVVGGDEGVMHPGTKARKFTVEIGKKWRPKLRQELDRAMARAAKRSGHGR